MIMQTSPEAPHIFRLIQRMNTAQKTAELREAATKAGVSEENFTAYLVYCCGVYANMGNYKVRSIATAMNLFVTWQIDRGYLRPLG